MSDEKKSLKTAKTPAPAAEEQALPAVVHAQFRAAFNFSVDGRTHHFAKGHMVDSQNYDLPRMLRQGAQLDMLDGMKGQAAADLADAIDW